jgi:phage-related protein
MSYLISGLNIKNIYEYVASESYEKYDIIDYQLNTGISTYPSYTGLDQTGLSFWFNNDSFDEAELDLDGKISGWVSKDFSYNLYQNDFNKRPVIDFNYNYTELKGLQSLSGSGFTLDQKTVFVCFNAKPHPRYEAQNILQFDDENNISESGFLKISGQDQYGYGKVFIDAISRNAVAPLYNTPNILTLIEGDHSPDVTGPYTIKVRQNGFLLGEYEMPYPGWLSGFFRIGNNDEDSEGIRYYDIFAFSGILEEERLDRYEKYLYEKYFDSEGLYWAKQNVPPGERYNPISYTGQAYWTRNINDLFRLSYGSNASFSSNLNRLDFGDGYKSNVSTNINSLNSSFTLKYDGLTDKQTKALVSYFEYTPEKQIKSLYEGFSGVNLNLFSPYKNNAELYFLDMDHTSIYNDINNIAIKAECLYPSSLNYKGMLVELDELNIRTYADNLEGFEYNDVVYVDNQVYRNRGYYFYTGSATTSALETQYSPTGINSLFTKTFYFKPDIEYSIQSQIRLGVAEYKSSTKEYVKNGINYNNLENIDLTFSNRSNREARAILKFLDDKAGFKIFDYALPQPYNKTIQVYCPEWSHSYDFYNSNTINVKFIEFKGRSSAVYTSFDTKVYFSN